MRPLIVDALASVRGKRVVTRDVIGAGPRSVAGVLEGIGLEPNVALAETLLGGSVDVGNYDVLLVSGMTSDIRAIRRVISRWRAESTGPVLVGGPVASDPEKALFKTKADLSVIGEGELTLMELLKLGLGKGQLPGHEELEGVLGVAYIEGETIRFYGLRPVMKREVYDGLTPSTNIIKDYPLHRSARIYVEVLRGCSNYQRAKIALHEDVCLKCNMCREESLEGRYDCPQGIPPGCGYCSVPSIHGPPKSRSVEKISEEVRGLLSKGARRIVLSAPGFLDYGRDLLVKPHPLTDPRHPEPNYSVLEELLSELTETDMVVEGEASIMIENIKGCLVTRKAADILGRHLNGTPVNLGFETGSREHSVMLGRPSTPHENLRALRRLKKVGLKPYVYFIHGLPGQTQTTVEETVQMIYRSVRSGASRIIMYRFRPLPMSAFHDQPMASPAEKDALSKRLHDAALNANAMIKVDLVGQRFRAVIAEPYKRDKHYHIAYPMLHGPVVLAEGGDDFVGEVVEVEVVGVVSRRMVYGRILDAMF